MIDDLGCTTTISGELWVRPAMPAPGFPAELAGAPIDWCVFRRSIYNEDAVAIFLENAVSAVGEAVWATNGPRNGGNTRCG